MASKEMRIELAYRIIENGHGKKFELYEINRNSNVKVLYLGKIQNPNNQFSIENPESQFKGLHPGNKIQRLIEQVFEDMEEKTPNYDAYPIINGEIFFEREFVIQNS